jgi:lipopolysaccharide transport system permease protein
MREVWKHRRFVGFLGARALRKTYARTALGKAWILITPLLPIVLRTIVFGGIVGVTSEGIPYFLFLTVGSVLWDLFAGAVMWGTRGLEMNRGVLGRIYIPKVILPIATTTPSLLDFAISCGVLAITLFFYALSHGRLYVVLSPALLVAPVVAILTLLFALSIGFFTSVWGETARDARFVMSQVLMIWFLFTPVLYPLSSVPAKWQWLVPLNPVAVYIETFKWSVLGIGRLDLAALAVSTLVVAGIFCAGLMFFSRAEGEASPVPA